MKLELKHISPYLPYGLKIYEPTQEKALMLDILITTYTTEKIGLPFLFEKGEYKTQNGLPILRPLSDLTKEIEHNGKNFNPIEVLRGEKWGKQLYWLGEDSKLFPNGYNSFDGLFIETDDYSIDIELDEVCYIKERLFEWHFDVFGLIENGLAVDINTIKE